MDAPSVVVDVRSRAEYEIRHVEGAINIPVDDLADRLADLPEPGEEEIGVYCSSGLRAERAARMLREWGYTVRVGQSLPREMAPKASAGLVASGAELHPCPDCKGRGRIYSLCRDCSDTHEHSCRPCGGTGKRAIAPAGLPGPFSSQPSNEMIFWAFAFAVDAVIVALTWKKLARLDQQIHQVVGQRGGIALRPRGTGA